MKKRAKEVFKNCIINEQQYSEHPAAVDAIYFYYKRNIYKAIYWSAGISFLITTFLLEQNSIFVHLGIFKHSIKTFLGL